MDNEIQTDAETENGEAAAETNEETTQEVSDGNAETDNVEELKTKEPDFKEKFYYLAAEMDNLKKRAEREKTQLLKFGTENILKDLIEVMDNFDLTLNALKMDKDEKVKNITFGINMVRDKFVEAITRHGLEPIDTNGKEFDPHFHEAIGQEEVEGKKENDIVTEQQTGYVLNGRVLRASKVTVAK